MTRHAARRLPTVFVYTSDNRLQIPLFHQEFRWMLSDPLHVLHHGASLLRYCVKMFVWMDIWIGIARLEPPRMRWKCDHVCATNCDKNEC